MEAEKEGGNVGGQEDVEQVRQRVVVVSGEGVGCWQRVLPGSMVWREIGVWRMKSMTVKGVGQNLD